MNKKPDAKIFSTHWHQTNWQLMTSNLVFMQNTRLAKKKKNAEITIALLINGWLITVI